MKSVGVALGGGGAKGLAHIPLLETIDAMGVRPAMVAGSSAGSIVGALYAAGATGAEIRQAVLALLRGDRRWPRMLRNSRLAHLFAFVDPHFGAGGLIKGERFLNALLQSMTARTFAELAIPYKVVAADFWARRQAVFDEGDLKQAVRASMALPGMVSPVIMNGRAYVDGGAVNPVPYDLLQERCEISIAIDVSGARLGDGDDVPSMFETVFNTYQIMQAAILHAKFDMAPPTIHVKPDIVDVRVLDFHRVEEIFDQAQPACDMLRRELGEILTGEEQPPARRAGGG